MQLSSASASLRPHSNLRQHLTVITIQKVPPAVIECVAGVETEVSLVGEVTLPVLGGNVANVGGRDHLK